MNFSEFKNKIQQLKNLSLGGLDAQFKMAPEMRLKYDKDKIKANNPRKAAVMALFFADNKGKTRFLLTKRASYKGTHSAQISFPGGKTEETDNNLEFTSKRETQEEVGVQPSQIKIIREMTNVYIPPSNFLVTPFLGFSENKPNFKANNEVDVLIEVLLEDLLNENSITTMEIKTSYMDKTKVPCFKLNDYIVWGATAMMLSEIKELFVS